ncbi:MAG: hypothetical protein JXK95_10860 [Bacteroidales bacterium]|nr:hypothetical protein [Bacteroidales bacterium]
MADHLKFAEIYKRFHLPDDAGLRREIAGMLISNRMKMVILDDDPTGIQTVHGCLLLTQWDDETLRMAFEDKVPFFYILTNSRSMDSAKAESVCREVTESVVRLNRAYGFQLVLISRSDSTLRGHFPHETDTIKDVLSAHNITSDFPVLFIPAFFEAGRYTLNNIHYMRNGDELIPVGETEFARDHVFGYHSSDLVKYIIEKSDSRITRNAIGSISMADIRDSEICEIIRIFEDLKKKAFVIVNAFSYYDLQKTSLALLTLSLKNREPLVLRTSSSMPKAISGLKNVPFLIKKDLIKINRPGFFIIGSHVQKTTGQIDMLLKSGEVKGIEVDVNRLPEIQGEMLIKTLESVRACLEQGLTPVVYTSRREVRTEDKSERLNLGKKTSSFLVEIIKKLPARPSYILAKGGITAHDILTNGLELQSARVAGQIMAGVPVVVTGSNHKYPSMPYIIFPGNVGDENALVTIFNMLN